MKTQQRGLLEAPYQTTVFTIGHGNKPLHLMIEKLKTVNIDRMIDVRSIPYSKWHPQFNRENLEYQLSLVDINYDWRGSNLGGLKVNVAFDENILRVASLAQYERIAIMCSESDFKKCHRHLTLEPALDVIGISVEHLLYDRV